MKLNKKGYTLIELLAVIILIALIAVIVIPNVLSNIDKSKNASYNIMISSIETASKNYFVECEYGDLSDTSKYGSYACSITNNEIEATLGDLANTGFLTGEYVKNGEAEEKIIYNPKNNQNINNCTIIITKKIDSNGKVTYEIKPNSSGASSCPTEYGSVN